MKVLVTIDDLGMAEDVNRGAEILLSKGVVHCLSIMATGPELPEAVELARNFNVAVSTVLVLIFAGAVAGFFPAWRAASIHTIEALKDE